MFFKKKKLNKLITSQKNNEMLFTNKDFVLIIFPVFLSILIQTSIASMDSFMVGASSSSPNEVLAVNSANQLIVFISALVTALASGCGLIFSRIFHNKELSFEEKENSFGTLIVFSVIISVIISALFFLFSPKILGLIFPNIDKNILKHSVTYAKIVCFSIPFLSFKEVASAILYSKRYTKISLTTSLTGIIFNAIFNFIFINVLNYGSAGSAVATLLCYVLVFVVSLLTIKNEFPYKIKIFSFFLKIKKDFIFLKESFLFCIPLTLEGALFNFGKMIVFSIAATMSATELIVFTYSSLIEVISSIFPSSISRAALIMASECNAKNQRKNISYYFKKLFLASQVLTFVSSLILILATFLILQTSLIPEDGRKSFILTMSLITLIKPFFFPLAFLPNQTLNGLGKTRISFYSSFFSMWTCRVFISYVFVKVFDLGAAGIWMAMFFNWFVSGQISFYFLKKEIGKFKIINFSSIGNFIKKVFKSFLGFITLSFLERKVVKEIEVE